MPKKKENADLAKIIKECFDAGYTYQDTMDFLNAGEHYTPTGLEWNHTRFSNYVHKKKITKSSVQKKTTSTLHVVGKEITREVLEQVVVKEGRGHVEAAHRLNEMGYVTRRNEKFSPHHIGYYLKRYRLKEKSEAPQATPQQPKETAETPQHMPPPPAHDAIHKTTLIQMVMACNLPDNAKMETIRYIMG